MAVADRRPKLCKLAGEYSDAELKMIRVVWRASGISCGMAPNVAGAS